ncbi:ABC transporter ATP-binding protein [Intrasporangium flavum]|uniref:ABC transporter ATP-binding protein n=1 Tax=Intrasporangium flavum TaxID=1428657 RepID=UPI00096FA267|nr:dipeptide ABC transporter ATP-binding protein [Intrasporangium flavum]
MTASPATAPTPASTTSEPLLKVTDLTKHFPIRRGLLQRVVGAVRAVDGLNFEVSKGETLSLVGESGCGKTTTGRMLTRLLEPTKGEILFEGRDITHASVGQMRPLRRDVQMIFQDPYGSLNPRHTVGTIVGKPFRLQNVKTEHGIKREVQGLLELVGLNPEHYNRYPHEFSGGQRQRIGIARSLALKPKLIVADEPVSALDVSIQAQVINLLEDLQDELGLTYVVIAHDLSVVRHMSDRVAVMYLGNLVEIADRDELYARPMHPYTTALMSAVPIPDPSRRGRTERIRLEGDVPSPISPPPACRFHTRCWKAQEVCKTETPPLVELAPGHAVACHFPENVDLPDPAVRPGASSPLQAAAAELSPGGEVPHDDASRDAPRVIPLDASREDAPVDAPERTDASGDAPGDVPDDAPGGPSKPEDA